VGPTRLIVLGLAEKKTTGEEAVYGGIWCMNGDPSQRDGGRRLVMIIGSGSGTARRCSNWYAFMKACVNCEKGVIHQFAGHRALDVSRTQMRFTWDFSFTAIM
jgi:hypothetical protein